MSFTLNEKERIVEVKEHNSCDFSPTSIATKEITSSGEVVERTRTVTGHNSVDYDPVIKTVETKRPISYTDVW